MKLTAKKTEISKKFFLCPASDYLNEHNETGSHGQLSYNFMQHLARNSTVKSIFAVVMMSLPVAQISKTDISIQVHKKGKNATLNDFDSLYFYLISFIHFFRSDIYRNADIIHHIIPFKFGRTFNLFFIWKDDKKKYIIGPIVSPHINEQISSDEEYVYVAKKPLSEKISAAFLKTIKVISLRLFGSILNQLSIKTLQNADILFFSDNYSLNRHKKFIKKNQKVLLLDTGINLDVFKPPAKKKMKKKNDSLSILFVGRLTKRKGCEYLIRAIDEVVHVRKDLNINCSIIGSGPSESSLKNLVSELKLNKYITFVGNVKNENIVSYYHANDIVCIPALSDTFTSMKEALSSGCPVIATDVCSHKERVKSGVNGFLVPPADSQSIATVIHNLAKNPTHINLLSKNAPKHRMNYDWDNIITKYLADIR